MGPIALAEINQDIASLGKSNHDVDQPFWNDNDFFDELSFHEHLVLSLARTEISISAEQTHRCRKFRK